MPKTVTEVFEGILGQKHRIVAMYKNSCCPIFWFQMAKDGSLYCAPNLDANENRKVFIGQEKVNAYGVVSFDMEHIEEKAIRVDPSTLDSFKISFHGSGIVNTIGDRVYRNPIRQIKKQEEICIVFFAHPAKFTSIQVARKTDIPLRLMLDDEYPLVLQISLSPLSGTRLASFPSERNDSVNMLFQFSEIDEIDKMNLQLSFGMPTKGEWPELSLMAFHTRDK